jgi:hypothetical protein
VRDTYTFGDDDVAARRLDLLAQVYGPPEPVEQELGELVATAH